MKYLKTSVLALAAVFAMGNLASAETVVPSTGHAILSVTSSTNLSYFYNVQTPGTSVSPWRSRHLLELRLQTNCVATCDVRRLFPTKIKQLCPAFNNSLTSLRVGVTADPSTGYAVAVMTTVGLRYR